MLKGLFTALAIGAAALGVSGVLSSASAETGAPKKKSYSIGLIAKSQSNPVFIAARTGAEDAAVELGKKYGVEIKIEWRTPVSEDAQKQAEAIEQLVASGIDGIAISATDAKVLTGAVNSAVDMGVPVVTFDSDIPQSKRFAYFGTDDVACGRLLGDTLANSMGKKGVVAILGGNQTAPNLQGRIRGVKEALKAYPDITIKGEFYHAETPQDAVAKVEQVQSANPEITGWAMVGGWPLFTANALDKVAGKAKVVAVDALPAQLSYVKSGEVDTLLAQQVYEWGTESVRLLMDKIVDGKTPENPIVNADLKPITKENAEEYGKSWDKWLGKTKK
jgi:ribose transport system substrate-binding protein